MKTTYETCGSFDVNKMTTQANTYLPSIEGAVYKYIEFYNISNDKEFGVFGVMMDNIGNNDLTKSSEPLKQVPVAPALDLEFINSKYATRLLTEIKETDTLFFFCWHDTAFNTDILKVFKEKKLSMTEIWEEVKAGLPNYESTSKPKKGTGGILSITGTCD
ncbi:hypothetical protein [Flavobacterium aciduliphilum]|uniref:Uncharacterized protein n=1 Tax=Flavobacterium aciduliphilum TaxID=1101402 RepID=A0A328Z071_9FLAO|nr:hypothetical protein [Flavobacterium aciduliphilum]RAR75676.1 hypothetical protein CLV55_101376 [Flavobacterium aciduliphilum]